MSVTSFEISFSTSSMYTPAVLYFTNRYTMLCTFFCFWESSGVQFVTTNRINHIWQQNTFFIYIRKYEQIVKNIFQVQVFLIMHLYFLFKINTAGTNLKRNFV